MTLKKKYLLSFLWFMVGMAAIIAIPLLLIEHCSQPRKAELRENQGQQRVSVDNPSGQSPTRGSPGGSGNEAPMKMPLQNY